MTAPAQDLQQDKQKEIAFFDGHAAADSYDVFTPARPVLAKEIAAVFRQAGFSLGTEFLSDLRCRYVASARVRWLLPLYNAIDGLVFAPRCMRPFRSFVLTFGEKP